MRFFACVLAISAALVNAALLHPREYYEEKFVDWLQEFEVKMESGEEFIQRLEIFADNHDFIELENSKNLTYQLGLNAFSHLTHDEFMQRYHLGPYAKYQVEIRSGEKDYNQGLRHHALADTVDWVSQGAVTGVKDQGQCGSCWAFSTTGALEGAYMLKNKKLESFSEQQLVDCDNVDAGCNGGLMDNAFGWIKRNGGICTESAYPYTARGSTCKKTCTSVAGSAVVSYTDVAASEAALTAAVAKQPVAVAIEADQRAFQSYKSGVFSDACGTNLDHGVLAVGYGTESGLDYYKVKNSWGTTWGDKGYIKIQKNKNQKGGQCGILLGASYPTV